MAFDWDTYRREHPEDFEPKKAIRGRPPEPKLSRYCECGKLITGRRNLCHECLKGIHKTTEGVKFVPPDTSFGFKTYKIGKKCLQEGCETLTENLSRYCYAHEKAVSKNVKYRTNVPEKKKQVLPSLEEFKDKLRPSKNKE